MRVRAKVYTRVKRSWNYKQESMWGSRLPRVGAKVHTKVLSMGVRVYMKA